MNPIGNSPTPPPIWGAPPTPAAPPPLPGPAGDRVSLGQTPPPLFPSQAGAPPLAAPPQSPAFAPPPVPTAAPPPLQGPRNGIQAQVIQDQSHIAINAVIPGGPGALLSLPLQISYQRTAEGATLQARPVGQEQAPPLPAAQGSDGKWYIQTSADPNQPFAVFAEDLSYGLSDRSQNGVRPRQEYLLADGTRRLIHDEQVVTGPQGEVAERRYTQVDIQGREVTAKKVVDRGGKPRDFKMTWDYETANEAYKVAMHRLKGGQTDYEETPFAASLGADGRVTLKPAGFKQYEESAARSGKMVEEGWWGWAKASFVNLGGGPGPQTLTPLSLGPR